jgi:hypothetical protein
MAFMLPATRNTLLNNWLDDRKRKALGFLFPTANDGGAGAVAGTGVSAVEYRDGDLRKTVITLTNLAQAVVNGTEYQSSKIYDFPLGLLQVVSVYGSIAQKTTSDLTSTLNASVTGAIGYGTAAASNVSLTSTMVNLGPSTAFTSSATINVAGTAVTTVLAAPVNINGAGTAADFYVNTAYATTGDVDADATQTLTGTITIIWRNLGSIV